MGLPARTHANQLARSREGIELILLELIRTKGKHACPIELFANLEPQNPPIGVSKLHKFSLMNKSWTFGLGKWKIIYVDFRYQLAGAADDTNTP